MHDEQILCVPAGHLERVGRFTGFRSAQDITLEELAPVAEQRFLPRGPLESDPSFVQMIPYAILRYEHLVFEYARGSTGTEKRLRAKRSLGIGGHVDHADAGTDEPAWIVGMKRELAEEVRLDPGWTWQLLGFLHDPELPVGRVHLGIAVEVRLASPRVVPCEEAIADARLSAIVEVATRRRDFETWSQFLLEQLELSRM
jgi:predicted NUDIX family phosphoesterase